MKRISLTFIGFIIFIGISCSKSKTCYRCIAISGGTSYNEKVCTDGDPKEKLSKTDANGVIGWTCTEQ